MHHSSKENVEFFIICYIHVFQNIFWIIYFNLEYFRNVQNIFHNHIISYHYYMFLKTISCSLFVHPTNFLQHPGNTENVSHPDKIVCDALPGAADAHRSLCTCVTGAFPRCRALRPASSSLQGFSYVFPSLPHTGWLFLHRHNPLDDFFPPERTHSSPAAQGRSRLRPQVAPSCPEAHTAQQPHRSSTRPPLHAARGAGHLVMSHLAGQGARCSGPARACAKSTDTTRSKMCILLWDQWTDSMWWKSVKKSHFLK